MTEERLRECAERVDGKALNVIGMLVAKADKKLASVATGDPRIERAKGVLPALRKAAEDPVAHHPFVAEAVSVLPMLRLAAQDNPEVEEARHYIVAAAGVLSLMAATSSGDADLQEELRQVADSADAACLDVPEILVGSAVGRFEDLKVTEGIGRVQDAANELRERLETAAKSASTPPEEAEFNGVYHGLDALAQSLESEDPVGAAAMRGARRSLAIAAALCAVYALNNESDDGGDDEVRLFEEASESQVRLKDE